MQGGNRFIDPVGLIALILALLLLVGTPSEARAESALADGASAGERVGLPDEAIAYMPRRSRPDSL